MSTTGSGNTWNKKNKYSICPFCGKKGRYVCELMVGNERMTATICKYCDC